MNSESSRLLQSLTARFGPFEVRDSGWYQFYCPKCDKQREHRKNFGIHLGSHHFHCFRCNRKGHLKELIGQFGVSLGVSRDTYKNNKETNSTTGFIPPEQVLGFKRLTPFDKSKIAEQCMEYLVKRKVGESRWKEMGVGYSESDQLLGRLIIPVIMYGKLVNYVARSVVGREPKELGGPVAHGWYGRDIMLFGIDDIQPKSEIFVVEGVWDREALHRIGIGHCVAALRSHLSQVQIGLLLNKTPTQITLVFDADFTGRAGAKQAKRDMKARFKRGRVVVIDLGEGDPDDLDGDELLRKLQP